MSLFSSFHFAQLILPYRFPWGVSDKFPALFNSTKKQRLLRCSALPYTKYGPLFRALYSLTFLSTLVLPDTP